MKYCIYCGASHEESDQFCSACGRGIVEEQVHYPDEGYPGEVVYEDDELYRVNLNEDEPFFVREEDEVSGHLHHQQHHQPSSLYHQQYHPSGDSYHQQYHPRAHEDDYSMMDEDDYSKSPYQRDKSTEKKGSGKGLILALGLIVGLALLAGAGYFVVYPAFFGDNDVSNEAYGEEDNDELEGEGDLTGNHDLATGEEDDGEQEESERRVQEVIAAIDGINSDALTFEDESVQGVRQMYNALTHEEQALVTNISRLEELEERVALLIAEEEERLLAEEERVKRFEVIETAMTWTQAYQYARSRGGYLATVVSQEEFDQIAQLASATGLRVLWLGAQRGAGGDFNWITGEEFVFSHWLPGEPTPPDGIENYLSMMLVDGQWRWVNIPNDVSDVYQAAWIGFVIAWDE